MENEKEAKKLLKSILNNIYSDCPKKNGTSEKIINISISKFPELYSGLISLLNKYNYSEGELLIVTEQDETEEHENYFKSKKMKNMVNYINFMYTKGFFN